MADLTDFLRGYIKWKFVERLIYTKVGSRVCEFVCVCVCITALHTCC